MTRRRPPHTIEPGAEADVLTTVAGKAVWAPPGPGGGADFGWFTVTDTAYGATGDGTTDDTAAVNAAIAALNTAGRGTLYFPAGTYKVTTGLTPITAHARILGDGAGDQQGQNAATTLFLSATTGDLLTLSADGMVVQDIAFENPTTVTQTAGSAIRVTKGDLNRYRNISVRGFYDCVNVEDGTNWDMQGCNLIGPVRYALYIRHIDLTDGGDHSISGCSFSAEDRDAQAAIRWESGGGLKLTTSKINTLYSTGHFTRGLDALFTNLTTVDLLVSNCSIENITDQAIKVDHDGTGTFGLIAITGVQVGYFAAGTTPAIELVDVYSATLSGLILYAAPSRAASAIVLTNVDGAVVGDRVVTGFSGDYTADGTSSGIVDGLAGGGAVDSVNGQTGVVVLDAADVGASPVGHSHGTAGQLEVVMTPGTSSPPVPLETPDGTDWLYVEV